MGALPLTPREAVDAWIARAAISLDPATLELDAHDARWVAIQDRLARASVVVLGELNHFVHEKAEFRLWWLRRLVDLTRRTGRRVVLVEELSWFDGQRVAGYLDDGVGASFDHLWTFGYAGDARADRDDSPRGILAASAALYPTALFKAEQIRFYRAARALGVRRFAGIDIGGQDAGYGMIGDRAAVARVPGESIDEEAARLERVVTDDPILATILAAMIDSLRYTALVNAAETYAELRPGMAFREEAMKRRLGEVLETLEPHDQLVLMAHAFHLAKDDGGIEAIGIGPGGDRVPSLGHHLVRTLGYEPFSVWWLYGEGEDSQPFPDLPKVAQFPRDSLNARLAARGGPLIAAVDGSLTVRVGHLYNQAPRVNVAQQADALFFLPNVTPLRAG